MLYKPPKKLPAFFIWSQFLFAIGNPLFSVTIPVTSTDSFYGNPGTLGAALYSAEDGDVIDCSPIAGQMISFIGNPLPAVGINFTSFTSSLTILGSGVTIDGGSAVTVFSLALGSATITDFTIQNGLSAGGSGGFGITGGGGALYIHSGTAMTISAISLNNNQAIGGHGGAGNSSGGSGAGGSGYSGGAGGFAAATGSTAGSGGGGNSGGTVGGRDGGAGSPNSFSNFGGAGGGERPTPPSGARTGGTTAASLSSPAHSGGAGGVSTANNGAGGGGGAGSGGSGFHGSNAADPPSSGSGIGGAGGIGFGSDNTYGAGGGAGYAGGSDMYGLGGAGGSGAGAPAGGGGGSGLGGPSSFMEEAFSSLKTASVFLATRRLLGLVARQRAVMEEMDPLLGKIFLSGREAV